MSLDEFDRRSAALDFRHVTTPWLKATLYPPARSAAQARTYRFVSGRQAWPWFLLKPWHPYPFTKRLSVMRDADAEPKRRDAIAMAAAPYLHPQLSASKQN